VEGAADDVGDDLSVSSSRLPSILPAARVASRSLLGGLATDEIARAFLASEGAIAQCPSEDVGRVRSPSRFMRKTSPLLDVVYLIFNEGYSATAGDDWVRPSLCDEALRLGRILAGLVPNEPEVCGLVALMEIQASRLRARTGPDGEPILLLDQDRAVGHLFIYLGLEALAKAESCGGAFALRAQASIVAVTSVPTPRVKRIKRIMMFTVLRPGGPLAHRRINRRSGGDGEESAWGLAIVDTPGVGDNEAITR
jgi:predicted RNA polymerase sigma factor